MRSHTVRALVLGTLVVAMAKPVSAGPPEERGLEIYFIDVLGGAATLLVTPERESILIDTGWPGSDDRDPARIAAVLKDRAGCSQLDHLITTHWHRDHFGGVEGLAKLVRIEHFWDRGLPEDPGAEPDFPDGPAASDPLGSAYRAASRGKRKALKAGDTLPLKSVHALVLASGGKVASPLAAGRLAPDAVNPLCDESPPDRPEDKSDNARSVALLFWMGMFQFFDAGDLTWNVEKQLVCPVDLVRAVDLYQVTHHGMDISNHPTLVRTLKPVVAIMNNGPHKGGGPATVKLLKSIPSIKAAYQLHKNADTSAEDNTDPALIANHDEKGGEYICVRVEPDGSKFTVQIGAKGTPRTFESH
jgi:competence protein ComEC